MIALTITLSGCAGKPVGTNIINQNNQTWKLKEANTHYKDGILTASGYMKPCKSFANRKGHIDIIAYSPDNQILFKKSAQLGKRALRRGGNYFSLEYKIEIPLGTSVTVEYHNQSDIDN